MNVIKSICFQNGYYMISFPYKWPSNGSLLCFKNVICYSKLFKATKREIK